MATCVRVRVRVIVGAHTTRPHSSSVSTRPCSILHGDSAGRAGAIAPFCGAHSTVAAAAFVCGAVLYVCVRVDGAWARGGLLAAARLHYTPHQQHSTSLPRPPSACVRCARMCVRDKLVAPSDRFSLRAVVVVVVVARCA